MTDFALALRDQTSYGSRVAWDVLVVGGGVIGCAIAHRLARRGMGRVAVIERAVPGAEASSAAAGMIGAQSESKGPGVFFDFAMRSRNAWPAYAQALAQESGIDVGYWPCGL